MMEHGEAETRFTLPATAAANPRGTPPAGALQRLRGIRMRHPEGWMVLLSAAAWAFLAITPPAAHAGAPGWPGRAAGLAAMVIAMMLPLTAGSVRELARPGSAPPRRAFAGFIGAYLAVWMLAMFAIDAAWRLTVSIVGWTTGMGLAIAAAVLWELVRARGWRWRRPAPEAVPHALHVNGEDANPIRTGVTAGSGCVKSCWALMAACVAFSHSLPVMAAFFVVQLHGTYRRPAYPALAALAILAVCLASLALTMAGHPHHPHV